MPAIDIGESVNFYVQNSIHLYAPVGASLNSPAKLLVNQYSAYKEAFIPDEES